MKKYSYLILTLLWGASLAAVNLPDNIYFHAMQDEMARTKKELHVKGSAKPFYIAYRLLRPQITQEFAADLGQPYPLQNPVSFNGVTVSVYIYAGDKKNNSSGYEDDYYARTVLAGRTADSYASLRDALWQLTDLEYVKASNVADKKAAYKRRKNLTREPTDFSAAPKSSFVEEIPPLNLPPEAELEALVQKLSNQSAQYPYLEKYRVVLRFAQSAEYFLDSEDNFYQKYVPASQMILQALWHTRAGYEEKSSAVFALPTENIAGFAREKSNAFLQQVARSYQAQKGAAYLGPVLLMPYAAAGYLNQFFVKNVRYAKPLLSAVRETDPSAGKFRDKLGMRVISPLFSVFDRPLARVYQTEPLAGFMPVDGEGVTAQELQLVANGKLITLPSARSLMAGQKQSNGHGRLGNVYPRATVTNVFFEAKNALAHDQLEKELLARCREQELDYCYIFHVFPGQPGADQLATAERIYTTDGHKESIYGLEWSEVSSGSLRDIWASGDKNEVFSTAENGVSWSVVAPGLLIDNIELMPTQRKPDQKPFVSLP